MIGQKSVIKPIQVSFIGTYPPRQCGIGTFTHDLAQGISQFVGEPLGNGDAVRVIALSNQPQGYNYGPEVQFEIQAQRRDDYKKAADFLNLSDTDVVCLQHEFGIFGGDDGNYILHLLDNLTRPVVTTLHTVLREPTPGQRETLRAVCDSSTFVVVMAQKAIEMLVDIYGIPRDKITLIYHGAPDVPFLDPAYTKDQFQAAGREVILTFGLLNPNKGIEVAIEAISQLVDEFPDLLYIVLGATHPEVKRRFGEEYRLSLERLVKHKGLEEHVIFYDRFVSLKQLIQFLVAADIYLTPYRSKEQITSGTLTYALAGGKAIVSTPYWYAEELLADGRGVLVPFQDPEAIAEQLRRLLRDRSVRDALRKQAYQFGRQMIWPQVASAYLTLFQRALQERRRSAVGWRIHKQTGEWHSLPEVKLDHLRALTDDTGIYQHALFTVPDRRYGYTTDDNARAIVVAVRNWELFKDDAVIPLLTRYLSFVHYAFDKDTGRVRNFMSYDRRFIDRIGSEDSHGRTLWGLGEAIASAPTKEILGFTTQLFQLALPACTSFTSPRAWAYSILGILAYLKRFGGDREAQRIGAELAERLWKTFVDNATPDWPWNEEKVAYGNARLPQALIAGGEFLGNDQMRDTGLKSLEWLLEVQTNPQEGHLSIIGNNGWFLRGGPRARFDQQPIEAAALIDACYEALEVKQDPQWRKGIELCFDWFLGQNDVHQALVDLHTGGCRDGLHAAGVNQNQGAESTISWLMALQRRHKVLHERPLTG
jgi:glycosyltransferase involved in cell wall biosynthesis